MLDDQRHILLNSILPILKENKVDVILISGDIFDNFNPSYEAIRLYDDFLTEVNKAKIKIIAISGNHDSSTRIQDHKELLKESGYYVSGFYEGKIDKVTLFDEFGPVNFYLLPFVTPQIVSRYYPKLMRISDDYNKAFKVIFNHEVIDEKERNVILSHQFVVGASRDPSDTKPLLGVGLSDAVSLNYFKIFDYAALGHIHKTMSFNDGHIVYPGSILPYAEGESNDRYISIVDLKNKGEFSQKFIKLSPLRKLLVIKGTYSEIMSGPDDKENFIVIVLTDSVSSPNLSSDFFSKFPNLLNIRRMVNQTDHNDLSNNDNYEPTKTPLDVIADFYTLRTGKKLTNDEIEIINEAMETALKEIN